MHEGHRQRMYEKLKSGDNLYEHELLEILLFNAYARTNTNPIAHALLKTFGSIQGVLDADVEALCTVEGVGKSVALYLKCIGECMKRKDALNSSGSIVLKNYADFKKFTASRLGGIRSEVLEIYCISKNGGVKSVFSYTTDERSRVEVKTETVARVLATEKPYGLLVAHNHLSGDCKPSENDDKFTMKVQLMCSMNNVILFDHCIYASDKNIYSYFATGEIDKIKANYSYDKLVENRIKLDKMQNKY